MDLYSFREFCLAMPGVEEGTPFGPETLVFKVGGKLFALCAMEPFERVNLKCDPERAVSLREEFEAIKPGWHMNKKHWNSVYIHELGDDHFFKELVEHSYQLVFDSLSAKQKKELS